MEKIFEERQKRAILEIERLEAGRNALKHGIYSAKAITNRVKVGALLRESRKLVRVQIRVDNQAERIEWAALS